MKNSTFSAQVANNLLTLLQGYSKTIRLLLVMFLTLTASTAWAEDYSIKFLTAASDGSTEITTSTRTSTVLENASCDYVTGFTSNCTKAYYKGKSGVKLSSSKASGTLEFNLADICKQNVSKIVFKTVQYSNESSTLTFYAGSTSLGTTTSGTTFTHTFNSSQEVSSIKITSSKRSYISEIIISTSGNAGGSTPTQLSAPTGLTESNITSSGATLSWNAVANASSYVVTIVDGGSLKKDYPVTGITTTVSDLESSTDYLWTVTAVGDGINYTNSEDSETGEFTTSAPAGGGGGEGKCSWKETAIGDIQSTDIVVITMTTSNGTTYAMSNNNGTSSAPTATKVTVSGTTLTGNIADNLKWNISNSNGTLTIYPNETTSTWLYCTATNNGVRVGTNTNKTFTIDATSGYLKHDNTSRYLGVYNNADWRCYTNTTGNTANQTLKFYVYQCSDDGGDDPEPVIVKTLKSIAVTDMTTTFEQGDVFKFDGTCTATYSVTKDGVAQADETAEVTPTNVSTPDMNQIGTQTVYVTYSEGGVEKTDDYEITITENTVTAGEYCITPNNEFWGTNFNGSLSGEALNQTYTGRQDDITIQYAKGSSQYMYINDSQTRVYSNNSLTFSVPSGYLITAIAFTADGNNWDGTHTANAGSMTDSKNWAGSANEVTITFGNKCYITKICVTYEEIDLTLPSAPTFNPEAGTYNAVQNVTISAEAGTTIYYTLDGTDPTTESNVYASAIEISKTTTVKAIAVKDEKVSLIASATYTINLPLTTMDQIFAKATAVGSTATSVEITFGNWVVTGVKGSNAYLTDGTKGLIIYTASHGFVVGDVLSGTVACKVQLYNGSSELTELVKTTEGLTVTTGGTVTPVVVNDVTTLNGVNTGSVIKITGTCESGNVVAGVKLYGTLYTFDNLTVGNKYNVTGVYLQYGDVQEILPRKQEDIEEVIDIPTATIAIADITMEVGEEKDIEATITPDAAQTKVQYAITAGSEYIDLDGTTITAVAAGTATITATIAEAAGEYYGTTKTFNVTVKPQNIAVLPFTFNGGKEDIKNTLGMSQTGLDDDYGSAPKLKFNGAGDNVIIHFDRQAGEFSFLLKQNGQNAGTFTVYESANGEDYTPVWSGGDFGNAQSETIKPTLSESARYVKFEYTTKGTSTNYALGSISIAKPDNRQEVTITYYGFGDGYTTDCETDPVIVITKGDTYQIPNCEPTDYDNTLNRTFAGTWIDDSGKSYKPGESFDVTKNTTLYAQWALNTSGNITLPTDVEDLATTDVVVTGGTTLTLQAGTTTINSLTLKGGLQENGTYAMPVVNIPNGATLVRKNTTINLDLVVNNDSWYPFAVPFEVANTAANVNYIDSTLKAYANAHNGYGNFYDIKEYNGVLRAENGEDKANNWVHVGRSNNEKLTPGKGYIISAVPAAGDSTVTIRITMNVDNAWFANGEQDSITVKEQTTTRNQVTVAAYTGTATDINKGGHQRHAGWNFVANPYLTNFTANENISGAGYINGEIIINNGEYSYGGEDVPYVTIPTYNFEHYYQLKLSDATLSPAYSFFVQVGTDGTMTFDVAGRQAAPASIAARNAEERPVKMDVDITLSDNHSSDQTGIIISDRYSDAYEIGRDLEKMFGSAYNLSVYTLMADNTPLAFQALAIRSNMQVIPVGYRAPEQGEYTFRLNEATSSIDLLNEQYEQLVLVDYQTGELTNLLIADYTFYSERTQADNRFAIYAVPRQNAPTDLPNAIGQDKQAQKIIHNGHLYILRDGNVYNGNGQIVK